MTRLLLILLATTLALPGLAEAGTKGPGPLHDIQYHGCDPNAFQCCTGQPEPGNIVKDEPPVTWDIMYYC